MYSDNGIAFDGLGLLKFDNDFARNVIIFGVDNSLSFHCDNRKNDFLVLRERPIDDINESISVAEV